MEEVKKGKQKKTSELNLSSQTDLKQSFSL